MKMYLSGRPMRTTSAEGTHPLEKWLSNLDLKVHPFDLMVFMYLLIGGVSLGLSFLFFFSHRGLVTV